MDACPLIIFGPVPAYRYVGYDATHFSGRIGAPRSLGKTWKMLEKAMEVIKAWTLDSKEVVFIGDDWGKVGIYI